MRVSRRSFIGSIGAWSSHAYAREEESVKSTTITLPDGRRLGVSTLGPDDGLPIVYFHGAPSCRLEIQLVRQSYLNKGRLIAVDRPGIGNSSYCVSTPTTFATDVRYVVESYLQNTVHQRVAIVGYSTGTPYALACAKELQHLSLGTAILAPRVPGAPGVQEGVLDAGIRAAVRYPRLAGAYLRRSVARLERHAQRPPSVSPASGLAHEDRAAFRRSYCFYRRLLLEATQCGVRGVLQDAANLLWPWGIDLLQVGNVTCWIGTCDLAAPVSGVRFLQREIPDLAVNIQDGRGHLTVLEQHIDDAVRLMQGRIDRHR